MAVAIHAANTALLLVLNAATGSRWRSLAVAALFAVHPINVESVAWLERDDVASAVPLLERAVAVSPRAVDARNALASAQLRAGRLGDAERTIRGALALGRDAESFAVLGAVLIEQGRLDEAAETLEEALVLRPDLPEALNGMGSALARRGRLQDAEARFTAAAAAAPYHDQIQANLVRCRALLAKGSR